MANPRELSRRLHSVGCAAIPALLAHCQFAHAWQSIHANALASLDPESVRSACSRMARAGVIRRTAGGRYVGKDVA